MKKIVATLKIYTDAGEGGYEWRNKSKIFSDLSTLGEVESWARTKNKEKRISDVEFFSLDEDEDISPFEGEPFID